MTSLSQKLTARKKKKKKLKKRNSQKSEMSHMMAQENILVEKIDDFIVDNNNTS